MKSKKNTVISMIAVALICTTALVPLSQVEEAEAAPIGTAIVVGFAAGLTLGLYLGYTLSPPSEGTTDPDVNDNYKALELKNIRSLVTTSNSMAGAILPSDTDMLGFTSNHWNRVIEYSVADTWSLDATYDPNGLLERNMTQTSLSTYLYNWQHALDNSYGQITTQQVLWDDYSIYDDCTVSLGSLWSRTSGDSGDSIDFLTTVSTSPGANKAYLRAVDETGDPFTSSGDKHIYVLGTEPVRLTTSLGLFVDIAPGKHVMSEILLSDGSTLSSGTYTVSGNGTIAGAFSAAGQHSAKIHGAIVTESVTTNLVYADDGILNVIAYDGESQNIDDLSFTLTYTDRHNETQTVLQNGDGATTIGDVLIAWDVMQQKVSDLLRRATVSGQVLWDLYDVAETARDEDGNLVYISPSSIIPNNEGVELDPQIQIALSVAALRQAGNYYASNSTAFDDMKIDISLNSSSMVCYGNIWNNGILIAENAVFSPYTYEQDMTITIGDMIEMNQAGVALVYGTTDDLDSFLAAPVDSISMLPLATGMSFECERIIADGEDVDEFALTLHRIVEHTTDVPGAVGPVAPVQLKDISILFVIISLLSAALLAMVGRATGRVSIVLIGLAIGIVGVYSADWTMRVYLGYEGLWDWLPWNRWF